MNNKTRCIAHEIRNQISICELYSKIIKKHLEKDGIENKSIDNALFCIDKSLKIIGNNLFDLKSIESNEPKIFDLQEILKTGIDMSVVYIQEKDINISLYCPDSCDVFIDENKFLACIVNIIKNAIESICEKGEIKISVKIDDFAFIKISNNGPIIPQDIQVHLFEEGYTTKKTGSGLGLAICKQNLKTQNAELKLIESTTKNTVFEIKLPIYKN